ncbi:MAG: chloride channel protein [Bacteroidales bacterium]
MSENLVVIILVISFVVLFKVIATSITFSSGGVGGIFAPTLFMGAHAGLLFAVVLSQLCLISRPVISFWLRWQV